MADKTRYDYGLTRYRSPEDGVKFDPEGFTFGKIADAAAKLMEWSEGALVVLGAAEYAAMRAAYDEKYPTEAEATDPAGAPVAPEALATPAGDVAPETPLSTAFPEPVESGYATPPVPVER